MIVGPCRTHTLVIPSCEPADPAAMRALLRPAAECVRRGGLVCFPTETVYGLGANALDERAVRSIFDAKGRPSDNPLIVHVASALEVRGLAIEVPSLATDLMERFWPGPLTLLLRRRGDLPDAVTAGLPTVGVRMPDHPVALELIRLAGVPLAAPSANTSGRPSPTTAHHVLEDLDGRVDWVVDGGRTGVGLESTVLDLTSDVPIILRPGGVTEEDLRDFLGAVGVDAWKGEAGEGPPRSPGMKYRHYSPEAEVSVVTGDAEKVRSWLLRELPLRRAAGDRVGLLCSEELVGVLGPEAQAGDSCKLVCWGSRGDAKALAGCLYDALRTMDAAEMNCILVEGVRQDGIGAAVMNRLTRAADGRVIEV